jgi:hypothetical protein
MLFYDNMLSDSLMLSCKMRASDKTLSSDNIMLAVVLFDNNNVI